MTEKGLQPTKLEFLLIFYLIEILLAAFVSFKMLLGFLGILWVSLKCPHFYLEMVQ